MEICYRCGKELPKPFRCPHCNLTFCEEHSSQRAHKCIALSNQLGGMKPKPAVTKSIHYMEPGESPSRYPGKRKKRRKSFLGTGVTTRKVVLVAIILATSLGSILMLNQWQPTPVDPGVGAKFPISPETVKLQQYVVELVNEERGKQGLDLLGYDNHSVAQRYAETMLETDTYRHNPELPGTMGENIDVFDLPQEHNVTQVLELMFTTRSMTPTASSTRSSARVSAATDSGSASAGMRRSTRSRGN